MRSRALAAPAPQKRLRSSPVSARDSPVVIAVLKSSTHSHTSPWRSRAPWTFGRPEPAAGSGDGVGRISHASSAAENPGSLAPTGVVKPAAAVRSHSAVVGSRLPCTFAKARAANQDTRTTGASAGAPAEAPVVRVSWFAARAFAKVQGKRLPTTAEWERTAAAGFTTPVGASEPGFSAALLAWLMRPTPSPLPAAGSGRPNVHGARDLHGLVWEWVEDFNTAMTTGESRADTGLERNLFCGAGAASARDLTDYPAFMRAAMRSSLRASYAVPNVGFRCARSLPAAAAAPDLP